MSHEMKELREMLNSELVKLSNKGITTSSLDMIDKLSHSIKSIDTIMAMQGDDYSERDGYSRTGGYSYRRNYSRDMMPRRYSRDNYSRGDYSMGYSMADEKQGVMDELRDMLDSTSDSKLRQAIQKVINTLE